MHTMDEKSRLVSGAHTNGNSAILANHGAIKDQLLGNGPLDAPPVITVAGNGASAHAEVSSLFAKATSHPGRGRVLFVCLPYFSCSRAWLHTFAYIHRISSLGAANDSPTRAADVVEFWPRSSAHFLLLGARSVGLFFVVRRFARYLILVDAPRS